MKLKLELIFKDRVGIVSDLSALLAGHAFTIASMEVERKTDKAYVYIEAEKWDEEVKRAALFDVLAKIPDVLEFRIVETLPGEEREKRFTVILDNISDGVLSIDSRGRVTAINAVARDVYGCDLDTVGKPLSSLGLPDNGLLECLEGKELLNAKREVTTPGGRVQYFVTRRPIRDSNDRIVGAVELARDMREIRQLARSITDPEQVSFGDIVGQDAAIAFAISFAEKVASTDSIISIRGESGTGKELFARAIHSASGRSGPFVPVNCAALPEQLLESELFGYERGAFTGGRREGKQGLFEVARGGTLFLDEIGDMPLTSQVKILRVIQESRMRRLGGSQEVSVDTRIITATNRTLERLVEEGRFRQDLYYRINVLPIHIPPLKERLDDIPLLVDHFLLSLATRLDQPARSLTPDALEKLRAHHWPGNVRELKNVVERAAILCTGQLVRESHILFSHELEAGMARSVARYTPVAASGMREAVAEFERGIIRDALRRSRSIRKAAQVLGVSHSSLLAKMRKLGVVVE
ncbi:sigma 54-interacting transcriptional regulator [Oleidesulfovibrio sp.]|uniref:sigma 54-interacting transcriptional regulator n=1 Tax=Oleidesulfovibrio sp. TaxID=2909707 RepID=UPI003A85ACB5